MFEEHETISCPPDDTIIWRYVSMEKFVAILAKRKLPFIRLDQFKDRWEGHWPQVLRDAFVATDPELGKLLDSLTRLRRTNYVSCWHSSAYESAALWDQYQFAGASFAIRSTIARLKSAITSPMAMFIGNVKYMDFQGPVPKGTSFGFNALAPAFFKRRSFEHEREVRALFWVIPTEGISDSALNEMATAVEFDVDIEDLVETLFVSPTAPPWLTEAIPRILESFGVPNVPVQRSTLYDEYVV